MSATAPLTGAVGRAEAHQTVVWWGEKDNLTHGMCGRVGGQSGWRRWEGGWADRGAAVRTPATVIMDSDPWNTRCAQERHNHDGSKTERRKRVEVLKGEEEREMASAARLL